MTYRPRFLPGDKLTVEANALAELKIEKAAVEGERRMVRKDASNYNVIWRTPSPPTCHSNRSQPSNLTKVRATQRFSDRVCWGRHMLTDAQIR
jgi:hypothetical protein